MPCWLHVIISVCNGIIILPGQVLYGMLVACLETTLSQVCLLQNMELVEGVVNDFDCPLYILSPDFKVVSSTSIAAEVCFVHECHDQCKFVSNHTSVFVERESVSVDKLHFEHDYSVNNLYCLNLFCMNQ